LSPARRPAFRHSRTASSAASGARGDRVEARLQRAAPLRRTDLFVRAAGGEGVSGILHRGIEPLARTPALVLGCPGAAARALTSLSRSGRTQTRRTDGGGLDRKGR